MNALKSEAWRRDDRIYASDENEFFSMRIVQMRNDRILTLGVFVEPGPNPSSDELCTIKGINSIPVLTANEGMHIYLRCG